MAQAAGGLDVIAAGADSLGVTYAAASLVQMIGIEDATLVLRRFSLTDWPAFPLRASSDYMPIDERMMDLMAAGKMNVYAVQHRAYWKLVSPDTTPSARGRPYSLTLQRMKDWIDRAGALELMFLIHIYVPGGRPAEDTGAVFDIADERDTADLTERLRWLYDMGARIQMVCVDDYVNVREGEFQCKTEAEQERFGSIGRAHGHLMRRLWQELRPACPDLKLSIVSGPYSLAHMERFVTPAAGQRYLREMATEMPDEVAVVWTGPRITSPTITRNDWQRYQQLVPRQPLYVWDNNQGGAPLPGFFVDFYHGMERDSTWGLLYSNSHFVGWPHTLPAALCGNAYLWNPATYDARAAHEEAFRKAFGPVPYELVEAVSEGHATARRTVGGQGSDAEELLNTVTRVCDAVATLEKMGVPMAVPKRQMAAAGVTPKIADRLQRVPTATVPRVTDSPTLDGRLDEPAWEAATELPPFEHYESSETTAFDGKLHPTECRLMHDGEALYIGLSCHHGDVELRQHEHVGKRDRPIFFASDAVEVFLDPVPADSEYAHLVIDHTGTVFDEMPKGDLAWDGEWEAAVHKESGLWHVEMRVPFAALGAPSPQPGDRWRANFCRSFAQEPDQLSCWARIYGSFHNRPFFGRLEFR